MANFVSFSLKGDKELMRKLKALEKKTQAKVVRSAVTKAMTPVRRRMRADAPKRTKTLVRAIQKKVKVYPRAGVVVGLVGVSRGFKRAVGVVRSGKGKGRVVYEDPANIAHLLEYGHNIVKAGSLSTHTKRRGVGKGVDQVKEKGTGQVVGFVRARPFIKKALSSGQGQVFGDYRRLVKAGILKLAKGTK